MNEINNLKKKIKFRAEYRGTKEMDLLLGSFVKKYLDSFSTEDLNDLYKVLNISDEDLTKWFLKKKDRIELPNNNVTNLLKDWGLINIIGEVKEVAPLSQIKVLSFNEKSEWTLETKYKIGKKKEA